MNVNRSTWTTARLRKVLSDLNLNTSGVKSELLYRLDNYYAYDEQKIISGQFFKNLIPNWPVYGRFNSVTLSDRNSFPQITEECISKYVHYYSNSPHPLSESESVMENSILALSYCKEFEKDSKLLDDPMSNIYLSGIVCTDTWKISYISRAVILADSPKILYSECECSEGKGPNGCCKHVIGILIAIVHLIDHKVLKIKKSSKEVIHSAKKPRIEHTGRPVKADEMSKVILEIDDDPRPLKYRSYPGFVDNLRNKTVAFCYQSGLDISWKYTFPRANIEQAALDHDYLEKSMLEYDNPNRRVEI